MISRLKDTILLVGDSQERATLRSVFDSDYDLLEAENTLQAAMLLAQNGHCIAAVLADLPFDDDTAIRALSAACRSGDEDIPLIFFVNEYDGETQEELAFSLGADDVVRKPYVPGSARRRLQLLTDIYLHRWQLEKVVSQQSETIRNTNQVMLDALSAIIEHRSTESGKHVLRIRNFTRILLEEVAANYPEYGLNEDLIQVITSASALHDIGKISIPDAILNKPGKLTEEEFEIMKTHTTVGGELVRHLSGIGDEEYLRYAYNIALYHHERWDGNGYPAGLVGDEIPICAQVVAIADVYDALTTQRAYKKAYSCQRAVNMILNGECGQFSPALYECFKRVRHEFSILAIKYADGYSPNSDTITVPLPAPVWRGGALNSAQLTQVKYQTLMHYTGDTVVELNLDDNVYHVVYSPDADLDPLVSGSSLNEILNSFLFSSVHPDDAETANALRQCIAEEFFSSGLRRKSAVLRLYLATTSTYESVRVTFLRINTKNAQQRTALLVLHRMSTQDAEAIPSPPLVQEIYASPALQGLLSSALRCRNDEALTIDAGADSLFYLTGYTPKDIELQFGGQLRSLIYEEDCKRTLSVMSEALVSLGKYETEFRLKCKDGSTRWVHDTCRGFLEKDGFVYLYHAINDYSHVKETYRRYEEDIERNQAIIDQSNSIVFEWDIRSDTMYCSPKWEEHFGYAPVSKNYGAQMGIATHFHPDDLPVVREAIRQAKENLSPFSFDVRISNKNAKYLWTHVSGTVQLDDHGELKRIIGVLQDVDAIKRAEFALIERAERDALTQLLNKATTQQAVSDAMNVYTEELSALLVLDMDNFKRINDTYGHLYGDAVLTQVGTTLKRMFREGDIIGRVGGDEFVVYMQNIPSVELLHRRCQLLLEAFRGIMAENAPDLNVSCSVGAALFPNHGETYASLFQHADEALYHAKNAGKNTYRVYDPSMEITMGDLERTATDIDSDHQPGLADGSFVQFVFHRLYESQDILSTIDELLRYVGTQLNVDRVYIFENNADNTACSNTFEWCNEGVPPEIDELQNVSYIDDIAGWPEVFDERGMFYCTDITALAPHFRAILEPQGIKSMLQCAIFDRGVFRGYVGFDDCTVNRMWTKEQIEMLQFLAEVLAMFLLKKRTQDTMGELLQGLMGILDRQKEWIYVIDPKNYELKFLNAAAKKLSPEAKPGDICYRTFMRSNEPCENCPAKSFDPATENSTFIDNEALNIHAHVNASKIDWKGSPVFMLSVEELDHE